LINGLSPLIAAIVTVVPLLFPLLTTLTVEVSFYLSITVGLIILFALGTFLGRVSRSNIIVSGLKTLAAGIFVVVMMWIVSNLQLIG
jgi:predicted membrane protein (TIGR00267 family)